MPEEMPSNAYSARLNRLLTFLKTDPQNASLLEDAADAALGANQPVVALNLLDRLAAVAPLSATALNLASIAAMQQGDFVVSARNLEQLLATNTADPSIRFNLAWSWAMLKNFKGALAILDDRTTMALPQAAALRVQLLHDQGEFEVAHELVKSLLSHHANHPGLLAATSVLAMDMDDTALARECALRAGDHPDALTTLGLIALDEGEANAAELFEAALTRNSQSPRAWLGKGLTQLTSGKHAAAAENIQHGAELFDGHVGSWIAAGWAHIVNRDYRSARTAFEKGLAIDPNFSESHGSMAVLNIQDGRLDEARHQNETALRLDRRSFSGALAQALLLNGQGDVDRARSIIERALNTPIDDEGRTLIMALARQGFTS